MNIQLKDNILDLFKLEKDLSGSDKPEETLSFGFKPEFLENEFRSYDIVFNMEFKHREGAAFHVLYRSKFTTDTDITPSFKTSPFIFVNSPAIAYPFLRAYIANIMLLSGYDPIMLPTVNFQKLYNDNQKKLTDS
ncbi:protein-export chaperone SecB [Serratia fonticola]